MLLIIVLYFLAIIGIGIWSRRRAGSRDGFFVAHRKGTTPLITGSLFATIIGGSATVGLAGLGFKQGLTGAWWLLVGSIGLLILGFALAGKVRALALYTLPELVERQYDHRAGLAASILIVVAWVGVVSGQIVAAGKVLSVLGLGSPLFWMSIFTVVFVAYAVLGGQYSVIRTDVIQAVILLVGISAVVVVVFPLVEGLSGLKASLPPDYFSFPLSTRFDWKALLSFLILVGATYVVGPDMYTRLFCSKEEKTARESTFITAFFVFLFAFAIALIGMAARVLYPDIPAEQAFPQVVVGTLPAALRGIVLTALVAALMSSADTCLLSQSVILTEDVFRRFRPIDERKALLITRLSIIMLGLVALGVAITLKGVISSLLFAYAVFTCGLVIPVIAGFYRERLKVTSSGAMAALTGGGALALLGKIPGLAIPLKEDLGLVGFAVSAILLFGVSCLTRRRQPHKSML
jgi:SSS family solute:Na+ symporter